MYFIDVPIVNYPQIFIEQYIRQQVIYMQKQVILIMDSDLYPFGEYEPSTAISTSKMESILNTDICYSKADTIQKKPASKENKKAQTRVMVRKKFITGSLQQRNQLLQKIGIIRNLEIPSIIKIESVLEQEDGIHILMEYIPIACLSYLKKQTKDGLENVYNTLYDLERNLREEGIGITWDSTFIGATENGTNIKYYVDLSSMIITSQSAKLKKINEKQIHLLITQLKQSIQSTKNVGKKAEKKKTRKGSSINLNSEMLNRSKFDPEASYNSKNQNKSRQSINDINTPSQKLRIDWRQIEQNSQILNDFINVLEDSPENHHKRETMIDKIKQEGINKQKGRMNQQKIQQKKQELEISSQVQNDEEAIWEAENQQIVWQDLSLQEKAAAAIQRSRQVIKAFKKVTGLLK